MLMYLGELYQTDERFAEYINRFEKEKNLIIAIVKRHGGLDFLKLPSVKCNRSVGKELLSNVFLFHRQVDTFSQSRKREKSEVE